MKYRSNFIGPGLGAPPLAQPRQGELPRAPHMPDMADIVKMPRPPQSKWLIPPSDALRFRVSLQGVEPPIWRVFDIPANLRLPVLSATILASAAS